jgi:uncharacterized protein YijF (DUF1287 family)
LDEDPASWSLAVFLSHLGIISCDSVRVGNELGLQEMVQAVREGEKRRAHRAVKYRWPSMPTRAHTASSAIDINGGIELC